jgi:2-iminobutanoate/2-iminopropanoate deaminase
LSTYLENGKAPTSAVARCGDPIYVSGFPAFDPATGTVIEATGTVIEAPIERQTGSGCRAGEDSTQGGGR